ncbi:hypothetical protein BaRGS_00011168 [Batillaria attramentaria]|uniref:Myb/SANT-like DNA-binding domain-containing protein n=1 Tax=Batillaria attramentaria TaxID=370345 RepID=A0ABD0LDN6_9CAEN
MAAPTAKRARKKNFSHTEITTSALIDAYALKKGLLQSKFKSTLTVKKNKAWDDILAAVNAVSAVRRSKAEIQTKWTKLRSETRSILAQKKRPATGGGPPPNEGPYANIIADIIGNSDLITGIEGGLNTGDTEADLWTEWSSKDEEEEEASLLTESQRSLVAVSSPDTQLILIILMKIDMPKVWRSEFQGNHPHKTWYRHVAYCTPPDEEIERYCRPASCQL